MTAHRRVRIHDTTLRDGEQMPGVVFSFEEKLALAEKSVLFGADILDIMPIVSESEFRLTRELARMFGSKVSATCRSKKSDIDNAASTGIKRVTLFTPLSDLHITDKLGITRKENIVRAVGMIDYARSLGLAVDFAGEDSSRADLRYLAEFLRAIQDKVESFFFADTVGCLTAERTRKIIWYLKRNFKCPIGIHMHNDFGTATANTIEGVLAGADIFSGTFTGIGERAGNAPIEEVCVALKYLHDRDVKVKYEMLKDICGDVQNFSGVALQKHKPIVGENAFAHESGIHVDGILKNPATYEFIKPEAVGQKRRICIGKHSGRMAIEYFLREKLEGYFSAEDVDIILREIKASPEMQKSSFSDMDLLSMFSKIRSLRIRVTE